MALFRIKYKGLSDVRVISVKDAEKHGVKLSADLVWDHVGGLRGGQVVTDVTRPDHPNANRGILVENLSDDLMKVLKNEGAFTVSEVKDGNVEGEEIITGEAVDDTAGVVRDTTTGQTSVNPDADVDPATVKEQKKAGKTG